MKENRKVFFNWLQGSTIYWKISRCHLGEKILKGKEKKEENVKEKGRKRKENEKRGSKIIK
jgi:hypothetical protein